MSKKNIEQLTLATADQISTKDLLVSAIPNIDNYNGELSEFAVYFKDYSGEFPINFTPTYINLNNIDTSVQQKQLSEIESITFDKYGLVNALEFKTGEVITSRTDLYSGYLDTTYNPGYFTKYTPVQASNNQIISDSIVNYISTTGTKTTGNWSLLFDNTYIGFRKTIVSYIYQRSDSSGSLEVASEFKLYIYWDGPNATKIQGTGIIRYDKEYNQSATVIYPFTPILDNNDYAPQGLSSGSYETRLLYNRMLINIDGTNKKINKLPISPYCPGSGEETQGISITIESFA